MYIHFNPNLNVRTNENINKTTINLFKNETPKIRLMTVKIVFDSSRIPIIPLCTEKIIKNTNPSK